MWMIQDMFVEQRLVSSINMQNQKPKTKELNY